MIQMKKEKTNSVTVIAYNNQINRKFIPSQVQLTEIRYRFKILAERSTLP